MPGAHADLIGGSTCARRFACPGSYRLEQQAPTPPSSKYADEGTMLHYFTLEKIFDQQMLPDDLVGSWHAGQQLTANHANLRRDRQATSGMSLSHSPVRMTTFMAVPGT